MKCPKCDGEGKIADSDDGEPWSAWSSLPAGSDMAVRLGLVKPIDCPMCQGFGEVAAYAPHPEPVARLEPSSPMIDRAPGFDILVDPPAPHVCDLPPTYPGGICAFEPGAELFCRSCSKVWRLVKVEFDSTLQWRDISAEPAAIHYPGEPE